MTIIDLLKSAIEEFYANDTDLLSLNRVEQACAFRIGVYLDRLISKSDFNDVVVDCEYNKKGMDPKRINVDLVRPDLIVHQRGNKTNNLLIVEFKYGNNSDRSEDIKKLKNYTAIGGEYEYIIGVSVWIKNKKEKTFEEMKYFSKGHELTL